MDSTLRRSECSAASCLLQQMGQDTATTKEGVKLPRLMQLVLQVLDASTELNDHSWRSLHC